MSVTFDVETDPTERAAAPICPECNAQSGVRHGKLACTYQGPNDPYPCDGYGPTPAEALSGLNVSNVNAGVILFDLLGYGRDEKEYCGGTLDPADVLARLALADYKASALARPASESRGVYIDANGVAPGALMIECGLSSDRILRYAEALRTMATEAAAKGRRITYG